MTSWSTNRPARNADPKTYSSRVAGAIKNNIKLFVVGSVAYWQTNTAVSEFTNTETYHNY